MKNDNVLIFTYVIFMCNDALTKQFNKPKVSGTSLNVLHIYIKQKSPMNTLSQMCCEHPKLKALCNQP